MHIDKRGALVTVIIFARHGRREGARLRTASRKVTMRLKPMM